MPDTAGTVSNPYPVCLFCSWVVGMPYGIATSRARNAIVVRRRDIILLSEQQEATWLEGVFLVLLVVTDALFSPTCAAEAAINTRAHHRRSIQQTFFFRWQARFLRVSQLPGPATPAHRPTPLFSCFGFDLI